MRNRIPTELSNEATKEFLAIYTRLSGKTMSLEEAERQGLLLLEFLVNMFEIDDQG